MDELFSTIYESVFSEPEEIFPEVMEENYDIVFQAVINKALIFQITDKQNMYCGQIIITPTGKIKLIESNFVKLNRDQQIELFKKVVAFYKTVL